MRMPLPISRSPMKTYLQSPARQNPHLNHSSSPARGSVVRSNEPSRSQPVKRRLDFSQEAKASRSLTQPTASAKSSRFAANNSSARGRVNGALNGYSARDEASDEEAILHGELEEDEAEESMAMIGDGGGDIPDLGPDDEDFDDDNDIDLGIDAKSEEEVIPSKHAPSRGKARQGEAQRIASITEEDDGEPVQRKRGRPAKAAKAVAADEDREQRGSAKRRRSGNAIEEEVEEELEPEPKKQRTVGKTRGRKPANYAPTADDAGQSSSKPGPKGKRGHRRRSSDGAADTSLAVVPRGPPLPKARGLLISRREVPGGDGILRTRSGRNSYRPLAFWKNEHVDYDQDEAMDDAFSSRHERFMLPSIKEVHRVDEPEPPAKRRGRPTKTGGGSKGKRGKSSRDEGVTLFDEPAEPWEEEPGIVTGEAVIWRPEYEYEPPVDGDVDVESQQLAVSGLAIETKDIRHASFRFAKTLSLPFFGAGVVDLPPGSEKRPKNSRKMFLTFFVYMGAVLVTVNETAFRIGRGGMWFVPRGESSLSLPSPSFHPPYNLISLDTVSKFQGS